MALRKFAVAVGPLGITLFERIDSEDLTAIVGMPLIWLASVLRVVGFQVP